MTSSISDKPHTSSHKPHTRPAANGNAYHRRHITLGRRYGYFVSLMKLILPAAAVILIALVILWPLLDEQKKDFNVTVTQVDQKSADNILTFNATYSGMMGNNGQFTITAEKTEQASLEDDEIFLTNPKGDILSAAGAWYVITAKKGRLNKKLNTLELWGDVNAFQDSGIELLTDNVVIDFQSNSGYGLDPVLGQGPVGNISADGFRIFNNGARIKLLGQSRIVIYDNGESS